MLSFLLAIYAKKGTDNESCVQAHGQKRMPITVSPTPWTVGTTSWYLPGHQPTTPAVIPHNFEHHRVNNQFCTMESEVVLPCLYSAYCSIKTFLSWKYHVPTHTSAMYDDLFVIRSYLKSLVIVELCMLLSFHEILAGCFTGSQKS